MRTSEAVAKRIKALLIKKDMSQYRLCKDMAIPETTLTHIMATKNKSVNLDTVLLICRGLGVTPSEFFADSMFESHELDV